MKPSKLVVLNSMEKAEISVLVGPPPNPCHKCGVNSFRNSETGERRVVIRGKSFSLGGFRECVCDNCGFIFETDLQASYNQQLTQKLTDKLSK